MITLQHSNQLRLVMLALMQSGKNVLEKCTEKTRALKPPILLIGEGPLQIGELSDSLRFSSTNVLRLYDKLEKKNRRGPSSLPVTLVRPYSTLYVRT